MIQQYKRHIRYWFATRFGGLPKYKKDCCEITCPHCKMPTIIVDECTQQTCYFCNAKLDEGNIEESEDNQELPTVEMTQSERKIAL